MIVDGHSHVTLPIEEQIQEMDVYGVEKTILFSTTFHPELAKNIQEVEASMTFLHELLSGQKGSIVEARKNAIRELVGVIQQYPQRYVGFGAVPPGLDLDTTAEYVETHVVKNNLVGLGEFTLGHGQIPLLENIFKASAMFHNLPLWVHAFFPLQLQDIQEIATFATQYKDIPVILGHLGGNNWLESLRLSKEIPNLYLDTSAFYSTFILGTIINEIPEKCIFGVDRPFGDLSLSIEAVKKMAKNTDVVAGVLGENVCRLLKM